MREQLRILTEHFSTPGRTTLDGYRATGGYAALTRTVRDGTPDALVAEVKASALRGRGGAGFPTGLKWSFLPTDSPKPRYLCANADESEPGTFKDRALMVRDPHRVLEGIILASYAIRCHLAFIYIRGEMTDGIAAMRHALAEAYAAGILGVNILDSGYDLEVLLHVGAGAYICGEETGLLESLEGKRAYPRVKPPFPAVEGLFRCPTVVNNVETLANLPIIVERGAAWYSRIGPERAKGTRLFCLSGRVERPGLYELPMDVTTRELVNDFGGGVLGGRRLKGVIPGGASAPILTPDEIDVRMDFDSLAAAGSMAGSAGVIVLDETVCMVQAAENLARFFAHESCGQCTPCRDGTPWLRDIFHRIEVGRGRPEDPDFVLEMCGNIRGRTICALGDAAAMPAEAFVRKYRDEFDAHIRAQRCPMAA